MNINKYVLINKKLRKEFKFHYERNMEKLNIWNDQTRHFSLQFPPPPIYSPTLYVHVHTLFQLHTISYQTHTQFLVKLVGFGDGETRWGGNSDVYEHHRRVATHCSTNTPGFSFTIFSSFIRFFFVFFVLLMFIFKSLLLKLNSINCGSVFLFSTCMFCTV